MTNLVHRGIVHGSGSHDDGGTITSECGEMANFFRQATSGIILTTRSIKNLDKCDAQFTFYCLQLLIPSLTSLFRHVGLHRVGHLVIRASIEYQCRCIFQNLVEMAMGSGPVYVGRWVWSWAWLEEWPGLSICTCICRLCPSSESTTLSSHIH